MLTLGIETATERVSVALGSHEGLVGLVEITRGRRHAETLTPAVEFICRQADVRLSEIGAIAVDVGPGLFTGMRVGIAAAKAMAHALRINIVAVDSLEALAHGAGGIADGRVVASVIDARKGELFYALHRVDGEAVQRLGDPVCGDVDELVSDLLGRSQSTLLVGDGALKNAERIAESFACEIADAAHAHPSAASLVALGHARALREQWSEPDRVEACYLRRPDAEINWTTRAGGSGR